MPPGRGDEIDMFNLNLTTGPTVRPNDALRHQHDAWVDPLI
jgi:hypothetical protein